MTAGRSTCRRIVTAAVVAALIGLPACGQDDPAPAPGQGAGVAEELAAALLTPEDLGDGWSVSNPDPEQDLSSGVVTDEVRPMLPRVEFCEAAGGPGSAAGRAASALEWQAFRQLDLDTTPGEPDPTPSPGRPSRHHLVFVQEFLLTDEEAALEDTFEALAEGVRACWGETATYPDGETGRTEELQVPDLGDESIASREYVQEPGAGQQRATWDLRNVIARDGDVLVMATLAEITSPRVAPVLGTVEVEDLLATLADRLDGWQQEP